MTESFDKTQKKKMEGWGCDKPKINVTSFNLHLSQTRDIEG